MFEFPESISNLTAYFLIFASSATSFITSAFGIGGGAILLGFACLIDRSNKQTLKIKRKNIISQVKLKIPTFKKKNIPESLKKIPITKPGSRFLK